MCKHVAATLYGVGARLDRQPALFFELRGVKLNDLVGKAAGAAVKTLLTKAAAKPAGKSRRILDTAAGAPVDIGSVFGIEMATPAGASVAKSETKPPNKSKVKARRKKKTKRAQSHAAHRNRAIEKKRVRRPE
jgi:uncharacterized Zn finger protein